MKNGYLPIGVHPSRHTVAQGRPKTYSGVNGVRAKHAKEPTLQQPYIGPRRVFSGHRETYSGVLLGRGRGRCMAKLAMHDAPGVISTREYTQTLTNQLLCSFG